MATVLEQYKLRQSAWTAQSAAGQLPVEALLPMLELNYRIDVIETFQIICRSAPVTTDGKVLSFHYQLVDAYIQLLLAERKFGSRTDEAGLKRRQTAEESLQRVVQDNRRQFSSFKAGAPDLYKTTICKLVNTFLPIWMQYRETYIPIQLQ